MFDVKGVFINKIYYLVVVFSPSRCIIVTGIYELPVNITHLSVFCNIATDVEKLKEKYSANECHLRKLVSEVELLTVQQQKQQQELNARVVSVGLLSADINRLSEEIAVYLQPMFICND